MSIVTGSPASNFPQTGSNRTRSQAVAEIAEHAGGDDRSIVAARAGRAWDAAVREFNTVAWRFNRMVQDITLVTLTPDYTLNSDFRSPLRALILDSSSETIDEVSWMSYPEWTMAYPDQSSTASYPDIYTARNVHETGLVTFDPIPKAPFQYPKVRVHYHRRIALATSDGSRLDVPMEVDEAIFALALAKFMAKVTGFQTAESAGASPFYVTARALRSDVEREWRDYEDF